MGLLQAYRAAVVYELAEGAIRVGDKLGLDTALEALKFFLRDRKGSPDELMRFARVSRVEKVIRPYIEALL